MTHNSKKHPSNKKSLLDTIKTFQKTHLQKKYIAIHWKTFLILGLFLGIILLILLFSFLTQIQLQTDLRAALQEEYPILGKKDYYGESVLVTCRENSSCYCVKSKNNEEMCANVFGCTDCGINQKVCSINTGTCVEPKSKEDVRPVVQGWDKNKQALTCIATASFICHNPDEETGVCESLGKNEDCAAKRQICRNGMCEPVSYRAQGKQKIRGQLQPVVCVNNDSISCVCTGATDAGDACVETTLCEPCTNGCDPSTGQCLQSSDDRDNESEYLSEMGSKKEESEHANFVKNCNETITETSCPGERVYMGSYCDEDIGRCRRVCECRDKNGVLKTGCRTDEIGTDNYYPETTYSCEEGI